MRDCLSLRAASSHRQSLIRDALFRRWLEARALLREPPHRIPDATTSPTPEQEEALRLLMVVHYPRARAGKLGATAWDAAQRLFDLIVPSTTCDLRFLDAWNNLYEALGSSVKHEQSFLARYVSVLDRYIHRAES